MTALAVSVAIAAMSFYLMGPLLERMTGEKTDLSAFASLQGNVGMLFFWLTLSWTVAAFGEEIVFRGYLMERVAALVGGSTGWWVGLIVISVFFGLGHSYQGLPGMIETGVIGFAYGLIYLLSGRNIWMPILAHGFSDTIGFLLIYLGVVS